MVVPWVARAYFANIHVAVDAVVGIQSLIVHAFCFADITIVAHSITIVQYRLKFSDAIEVQERQCLLMLPAKDNITPFLNEVSAWKQYGPFEMLGCSSLSLLRTGLTRL